MLIRSGVGAVRLIDPFVMPSQLCAMKIGRLIMVDAAACVTGQLKADVLRGAAATF